MLVAEKRMNENERVRTLPLVVALCVRGRRIRNASIEISLNFEKKIFSFESSRERKKIFDFRFDFIPHEWLRD